LRQRYEGHFAQLTKSLKCGGYHFDGTAHAGPGSMQTRWTVWTKR